MSRRFLFLWFSTPLPHPHLPPPHIILPDVNADKLYMICIYGAAPCLLSPPIAGRTACCTGPSVAPEGEGGGGTDGAGSEGPLCVRL